MKSRASALPVFCRRVGQTPNPKQLSLSPPSRTAASASSQAGGESALEPLSTTKGRAGSRISKNQKHIQHPPSRTQVSSSLAHGLCLDASHQSTRLSQAPDVSCSWREPPVNPRTHWVLGFTYSSRLLPIVNPVQKTSPK